MKKILVTILFLITLAFLPSSANALTGTAYGGYSIFQLPCTCTGGAVWWAPFFPFYNVSVPMYAALSYTPGTFLYSSYTLHPAIWALGEYVPGAGACYMGVTPYCYKMPDIGYIEPLTGTSI